MKAVILAGGKGTRLGKLTHSIPKPMVKVGAYPILEHQVRLLVKSGIRDIVILNAYLSHITEQYFGDGTKWGCKIRHVKVDVEKSTADAVYQAKHLLSDDFLVLYGDTLVNFDIKRFITFHRKYRLAQIASIVLHPNNHPYDSDLADLEGVVIKKFLTKPHPDYVRYDNLVSAGVYILTPKIFSLMEGKNNVDFGRHIFPEAVDRGQVILGYRTFEYFKDMGTPERLNQVRKEYRAGLVDSKHWGKKQIAIFLDRDGVINEDVGLLHRILDLHVYPFAARAIREINSHGYLAVIVNNAPMIAKGLVSISEYLEIHKELQMQLGHEGAYVDAFYFCPHHPGKGLPNAVKEYNKECSCRKPKPGMLLRAARELNIDLKRSWLVGDFSWDALAAERAGVKFVGVATGSGFKQDARFPVKKKYVRKSNLLTAVRYIFSQENYDSK